MIRLLTAIALCVSTLAAAADITVSTTASEGTRLSVAVGAKLSLRDGSGNLRSATAAEVKAHVIEYLRAIVSEQERQAAIDAQKATAVAFDPK